GPAASVTRRQPGRPRWWCGVTLASHRPRAPRRDPGRPAPTAASVSSVLYTVASDSVGNSRRTVACNSSALGWLSVAARCRKIASRCGVTARPAARHRATKPSRRSGIVPSIIILLGEYLLSAPGQAGRWGWVESDRRAGYHGSPRAAGPAGEVFAASLPFVWRPKRSGVRVPDGPVARAAARILAPAWQPPRLPAVQCARRRIV